MRDCILGGKSCQPIAEKFEIWASTGISIFLSMLDSLLYRGVNMSPFSAFTFLSSISNPNPAIMLCVS